MPETVAVKVRAEPSVVTLMAGDTAEVIAVLGNLGQTVDQLTLSIEGLDPSWYSLPVSSVALFPNDEDNLKIILHPPKSNETQAGSYTCRITVVSQENQDQKAMAELAIHIKALLELEMEIVPSSITGRSGTFVVGVRNTADREARMRLRASDPQDRLRFSNNPIDLIVPPEGRSEASVDVRPGWKAFFGSEKGFEFQVAAIPMEGGKGIEFCPYCGHKFQEGSSDLLVFCPYCSHDLLSESKTEEAKVAKAEFVRIPWHKTLPAIRLGRFSRSPEIISFGTSTEDRREFKISWSVKNAKDVMLNGEEVAAEGEKLVSPKETTEFTLVAGNKRGSIERSIQVYPLLVPDAKISDRIRASLTPSEIRANAGAAPGQVILQLQNLGDIVDKFSIEIDGVDQSWINRSAASLALMPQATDQMQITFQPPKSKGVRSGVYPFAVVVRSQSAPDEISRVTGQLEVLPFAEYSLEVHPVRVTCRRKGSFRAVIANTGVTDMGISIIGTDMEEGCRISFGDDNLKARAWETIEAPMIVRPKRGWFIGEKKRYDVSVSATGGDGATRLANCELNHHPFVGSWKTIFRILRAIIVLIIVIVIIYFVIKLGGGWGQLTSSPGDWARELAETIEGWFD